MVSENEICLSQHVDLVNMEADLFLLLTILNTQVMWHSAHSSSSLSSRETTHNTGNRKFTQCEKYHLPPCKELQPTDQGVLLIDVFSVSIAEKFLFYAKQ